MAGNLAQRLADEVKSAMKERNALVVETLRGLRAQVRYKEIEVGHELDDQEVVLVISTAAKMRRESIAAFDEGGRDELAEKERRELTILKSYLPEQMDDDELKRLVTEAVSEAGAKVPADVGKVMGVLMPKIKGKADGKLANQLVRDVLAAL